jgi:hypothetical protein
MDVIHEQAVQELVGPIVSLRAAATKEEEQKKKQEKRGQRLSHWKDVLKD